MNYSSFFNNAIKSHNIQTISEFENYLHTKEIKISSICSKHQYICYNRNGLRVDKIKQVVDEIIVLKNNEVFKNEQYVIFYLNNSKIELIKVLISLIMQIVFIIYPNPFSIALIVLIDNKLIMLLSTMIIFNSIMYEHNLVYLVLNYFILVSYLNRLFLIPLLLLYFVLPSDEYIYILEVVLLILLKYYYFLNKIQRLKTILISRKSIKSIFEVVIDNHVIASNGVYYIEINQFTHIYINNILSKYVEMNSIKNKLNIIYVKNKDSFYSSKYLGEHKCRNKIVIYLYQTKVDKIT